MQYPEHPKDKDRQRGFTLVELMITVVVISLLAAIAVPQYNSYVQSTHRSSAQVALQQASQWLERAMTAGGTYPGALPANLQTVEGGRYTLLYVPANNFSTYTLTAVAGSLQANDGCANLTLDQQGRKGRSGTQSVDMCWTR